MLRGPALCFEGFDQRSYAVVVEWFVSSGGGELSLRFSTRRGVYEQDVVCVLSGSMAHLLLRNYERIFEACAVHSDGKREAVPSITRQVIKPLDRLKYAAVLKCAVRSKCGAAGRTTAMG